MEEADVNKKKAGIFTRKRRTRENSGTIVPNERGTERAKCNIPSVCVLYTQTLVHRDGGDPRWAAIMMVSPLL